ncbi:MAG TPA: phosphonoacetaldehyde hydrolase [Deltaproteobacteria bacterium]|nr:phosphonoacetaldehyde hydrolase [Deltaproteobacteria bacterium]
MASPSNNKIKAVIFDWDGTIMDYGCLAPVRSIQETFGRKGIEAGTDDARLFLNMMGKGHIRDALLSGRIAMLWKERFGRQPCESDVSMLLAEYQEILTDNLASHTDPIPHSIEIFSELRERKIRIGITSVYSSTMLEPLIHYAALVGLEPDVVVTPDQVPGGRPHPWMIFEAASRLGIYPLHSMMKVGDTRLDILEGLNAGVWTVGVVKGGGELGLARDELEAMPGDLLEGKIASARRQLADEGAHYVVTSLRHLPSIVDEVNFRMAIGDTPVGRRQGTLGAQPCVPGGSRSQAGIRLMRVTRVSNL